MGEKHAITDVSTSLLTTKDFSSDLQTTQTLLTLCKFKLPLVLFASSSTREYSEKLHKTASGLDLDDGKLVTK